MTLGVCATAALCVGTAAAVGPDHMPAFQTKVYENGEPIAEKPGVLKDFIEMRHARGFTHREFADLKGVKHSLKEWAGHLLIVDIWATWCEPCVRSLPAMKALQERFDKEPASKIKVVSISLDRRASTVNKFLKRHGFEDYQTLIDPKSDIGDDVPIDVVPSVYVLDGNGNLVGFVRGYVDWSDAAVPAYLQALSKKYAAREGDIVN